MNEAEWQAIWDGMVGRWGEGRPEFVERRAAIWKKRFVLERQVDVEQAILALERRCAHFPALKDMHDALDIAKRREQVWKGGPHNRAVEQSPMTPKDRRDAARALCAAVDDRCRSGRGTGDDPVSRWLYAIAELYEENARRSERGEPIIGATAKGWRPPPSVSFGGMYGNAIRGLLSDQWTPTDPKRFAHIPFEDRPDSEST